MQPQVLNLIPLQKQRLTIMNYSSGRLETNWSWLDIMQILQRGKGLN